MMHSGSSGLKLVRQDPLPFTTMKIHASIAVISALIVSVLGFVPPQTIRVLVPALGSRRLMASPSYPFQALLSSTSDDNNDDSSHMKSSNDNNRLSKRYMAGTILFGLVAFILAAMPDRTKGVQLAGKYGGAAGYGLAAGTCHILSNAIKNNRLTTDSSRRLNVGLFFFCLISLFSLPGEAAFLPMFGPAVLLMTAMMFIKGWGCNLSYQGWKAGVEESRGLANMTSNQLLGQFARDVASSLKGIIKTPRKGFVYLFLLFMVVLGGFSSVMEAQFYMQYGAPLFNISLQWSALARLFFVSSIVYSLKDAAEQGRLTGIAFIQMNFMIAAWALFVAIGQGTYRLGFSTSKSPMILMSVPFMYGGIRSLYTRSNSVTPAQHLRNIDSKIESGNPLEDGSDTNVTSIKIDSSAEKVSKEVNRGLTDNIEPSLMSELDADDDSLANLPVDDSENHTQNDEDANERNGQNGSQQS